MDDKLAQVSDEPPAPAARRSSDRVVVPLGGMHVHRWQVAAVEHDGYGSVRMCRCSCGAARYDDRAIAG